MTKEDFSLKKDILQIEKKMNDLEMTSTELKEFVNKIDTSTIDDLKQRLEDVEDLVMVENAGLIELKKMLETSTQTQQPTQPPEELASKLDDLTNRLGVMEEKTSAQPDETGNNEIKTTLENLKNDVESKLSEIRTSVPNMDIVTNEIRREINQSIDWLKNEINAIVEERVASLEKQSSDMNEKVSKIPSPEELNSIVDGLANSFKSFRSSIEARFQTEQNRLEERMARVEDKSSLLNDLSKSIEEFRSDMNMKKEGLESMMGFIDEKLRMPLPERAVRELEKIRNDWIVSNARVDTIENLIKTFQRQLEDVRPALKKMETFDKLVDLHREVTQRLEEMKNYSNESKKLAEMLTDNRQFEKIEKKLKELERLKTSENNFEKMHDDMSILQGNIMSLEQGRTDLTAAIADLQEGSSRIGKRLNFSENILDSVQKDVEKSNDNLLKLGRSVETVQAHLKDVKAVYSEIHGLRDELVDLSKKHPKKELEELSGKIGSVQAEIENIKSLNQEDNTNELVSKIRELEARVDSLNSYATFADQMPEIVSRLVFVESRLVALEGMIQDVPRYSPIVVE